MITRAMQAWESADVARQLIRKDYNLDPGELNKVDLDILICNLVDYRRERIAGSF